MTWKHLCYLNVNKVSHFVGGFIRGSFDLLPTRTLSNSQQLVSQLSLISQTIILKMRIPQLFLPLSPIPVRLIDSHSYWSLIICQICPETFFFTFSKFLSLSLQLTVVVNISVTLSSVSACQRQYMCTDMLQTSGYLLHASCLPENLLFCGCCLSFFILFISQDQAILSFIPPHDIVILVLNANQSIQFQASSRGRHKLQRCICLVFLQFIFYMWVSFPLCGVVLGAQPSLSGP